jgi:hypothetical protein
MSSFCICTIYSESSVLRWPIFQREKQFIGGLFSNVLTFLCFINAFLETVRFRGDCQFSQESQENPHGVVQSRHQQ